MARRDGGLGAARPPSRNIETADLNHQDSHPESPRRQGRPAEIAGRQHEDLRPEASDSPA
ncbi:hypothetical protein [Tannerella forsythia]|uniref:hypothetical protein n=1 Tax=Tannerella forsythia TaxID=28112 RepID=UPI00242D1893|nr:hypothetical protein [Tannerella forsythia]